MITFIFGKEAVKEFLDLERVSRERISNKLKVLKNHPDIFSILVKLEGLGLATHRLRIGNIRLILKLEKQGREYIEFFILRLGHRREIYR